MKKSLLSIIFSLLIIIPHTYADASQNIATPFVQQQNSQMRAKRDMEFEQRLGLTEEQRIKAREARQKSYEKMKPVVEEIKNKKAEVESIKKSRMPVEVQEEKLTVLDQEIKELEKKAHEIKRNNMKDFEAILTKSQKNTLNQMKKEGRKNFNRGRCCPPPRHFN